MPTTPHAPLPSELALVSQRIAEIITDRGERADALRREIDRLHAVEVELDKLIDGAMALSMNIDESVLEPSISEALLEVLGSQRFVESKGQLGMVLFRLRVALGRMSRETVNIGVIGQARMGKSTLLQAITGLGEDQVPTGDDVPVTAAGSRIACIEPEVEASAEIVFYSYDEFRDVVLSPFFEALQIGGGAPRTKELFAKYELPELNIARHLESTLTRLKRMLARRADYIDYLDSPDFIIYDLAELRPFVAYPRNGEEAPERYHAVSCVGVKCAFPHGVARLVVMDMPGLGEVDPRAEKHHVQQLRNEVDMVFFVKRPTAATSFWSEHDANITRLIEQAKGDIGAVEDFCLLVLNCNTDDPAEAKRRQPLLRDLQDKSGFNRSRILECNAKKQNSVINGVVKPGLEHLVTRLPDMDRQVTQAALAQAEAVHSDTQSMIRELRRVVVIALRALGSAERDTDKRAAVLHEELAVRLLDVLRKLDPAQDAAVTPPPPPEVKKDGKGVVVLESPMIPRTGIRPGYREAIENAAAAACAVIDSEEALNFHQQYEARYAIDATPGFFLKNIYNYARVAIDRTICSYDEFLAQEVRAAWDDFLDVLAETALGPVLAEPAQEGDEPGLAIFLERLERIESQCPEITGALREFLKLRIRCESHFLHLYDQELYAINAMIRGSYGGAEGEQSGDFPNSREGAHQAYIQFFERSKQVVDRIKVALLEAAPLPPRIIHACAFRFFDRFCRPESAREEFALFCQEYRELIWPQLARPAQVRRDLESVRNSCDKILEAGGRRAIAPV